MKILDVGTANGLWMLYEACEHPENEYVGIDINERAYRLDSPERAYRWFCGQMTLRAQRKLGIDPNDEDIAEPVFYLGQDFTSDGGEFDNQAMELLEKYDKGRALLGTKVYSVIGDDEAAIIRNFVGPSPEIEEMTIKEIFSYQPEAACERIAGVLQRVEYRTADLMHMPFEDGTFDRVRAAGLVGNYASDEALAEAQRVLRKGRIVHTKEGIDTVYEDIDREPNPSE